MKDLTVAVLGAGSWGTALSLVLNSKGHSVNLWMRRKEQYDEIMIKRENHKYLPNVYIPKEIKVFNDVTDAIKNSDIIVFPFLYLFNNFINSFPFNLINSRIRNNQTR